MANLKQSYETGFLADEILLILKQVKNHATLDKDQITTLQEAIEHLSHTNLGFEWINNPIADPDAVENAFYFKQAVRILFPIVKTPQEFKDHISKLIDTTTKLASQEKVADDDIENLRNFFTGISRAELHNSMTVLSRKLDKEERLST